jgi:hydrogenase maturation factor
MDTETQACAVYKTPTDRYDTDMVASGFDPERVRCQAREAFAIAAEHKCPIEVQFKDIETVSGNLDAVPGFVRCMREVINAW